MSASSLIFVVVIAIWATYLLFYVTRRREHLATARSVDRFSAHMRVLQRRGSKPTASPPAHTSSVTLVRAVTTTTPYDVQADDAPEPAGADVGRHGTWFSPPPRSEMPVSETPRQVAAVGINRGFALLGRVTSVPAATVRRHVLLAAVGAMLITFLGAVSGLLGWWLFALSLLGFVGILAWSRSTVTAARAAFERRAAALRQARGLVDEVAARAASEARPSGPSIPVAQEPAGSGTSVASGFGRGERRTGRDEVFDFVQVQGKHGAGSTTFVAAGRVEPARGSEGLDPLGAAAGWAPVPVPVPTYTLKARAERPLPPPMPLEGLVPIEVDDEFDQWQRDTHGSEAAVNG